MYLYSALVMAGNLLGAPFGPSVNSATIKAHPKDSSGDPTRAERSGTPKANLIM